MVGGGSLVVDVALVVLVCLVGWLGWLECGTGVTEVTGSLRSR